MKFSTFPLRLWKLRSILFDMQYEFHHTVVGGTFDRFHFGHQKLLETAFEQSEKVDIGIATDDLFKDKNLVHIIEDYNNRKQHIAHFLFKNGLSDRAKLVSIHDFYGSTVIDEDLEAIFITESNRDNVDKINEKRQQKGFHPLEVITVPYVLGNDGEIISSERIRRGLIDREGNSYAKLFAMRSKFVLPEKERDTFRQPIGTISTDMKDVLASLNDKTMLLAVGDIVATTVAQYGRQADINVIDGKTRRNIFISDQAVSFFEMKQRTTNNPAGVITREATNSILAAITDYETTHEKQLIEVSGEEDLLAIPAILLAPLQTVVLYGQFGVGIVVVKVSEQNKNRVQNLFRKFQ